MSSNRFNMQALRGRAVAELLVVLAILAWWLTSKTMPPSVFPSPYNVAIELGAQFASAEFWGHAAATAIRISLAVILSTLIGAAIGLVPRYAPWTRGIVDDVLIPFFSSFPAIAWAILGTIFFGINDTAIVVIQILIVLPFCLVNVSEGAKDLGAEEVEMGRSFGRSRWAIFWRIELPLISPFVMAAARISYGISWKVSLIAELFGARSGLGFLMQVAQDFGRVDTIMAICIVIVVFVVIGEFLILNPLTGWLARRVGGKGPKTLARTETTPLGANA